MSWLQKIDEIPVKNQQLVAKIKDSQIIKTDKITSI